MDISRETAGVVWCDKQLLQAFKNDANNSHQVINARVKK